MGIIQKKLSYASYVGPFLAYLNRTFALSLIRYLNADNTWVTEVFKKVDLVMRY
jgi:hypothetical protein